jgi:uncharacterized integral membrane protein (TIGR00698 family)
MKAAVMTVKNETLGFTALRLPEALPGVAACLAIAGLGIALHGARGFSFISPLMLSMIIGTLIGNLAGAQPLLRPGIRFSIRRLLRLAIVTLGLQITFQQLGSVGVVALAIIAISLVATLAFTKAVAPLLGVDAKLAELIAAGTAICGASAVVAVNTVTEGQDEDIAYAIGCVTIFGCLAAFAYPLLAAPLLLSQHAFGLWAGSSIHEIAQVVASAFQAGAEAGRYGTIAKLSRVAMLAPVVLALGALRNAGKTQTSHARAPWPWFILGFVLMIALNSVFHTGTRYAAAITQATNFLMSVSLAAMGLETRLTVLRAKGVRPLLLGAVATLFISGISLSMIKLLHPF